MSTVDQDLTAQHDALITLGLDRHASSSTRGLSGANRERPGLRKARAACRSPLAARRSDDTLVVTKLDRLAAPCATPATSSMTLSLPGES